MPQISKIPLNIACAIDDSFAFPLSVMIASVLENHKNENIVIHLFSASLSESYILLFEKLVTKYNQSFKFYRLNAEVFKDLPINDRISYAAYYRILMPSNIDSSVERFLYLDADIIVNGNLSSLFSIDLKEKIYAAVNDIVAIDWNMHKKHNIPENYLYFNSGVLLIDRAKWIEKLATEKVFKYLNDFKSICDYHDQDGLNGALYNERYPLSPIWNQQIGLFFIKHSLLEQVYSLDFWNAIKKPIIIHFNGIEKPWHFVSAHPFRKLFDKYADLVKDFSFKNTFSMKKAIKRFVVYRFLGWGKVNKYFYYKTKPVN